MHGCETVYALYGPSQFRTSMVVELDGVAELDMAKELGKATEFGRVAKLGKAAKLGIGELEHSRWETGSSCCLEAGSMGSNSSNLRTLLECYFMLSYNAAEWYFKIL